MHLAGYFVKAFLKFHGSDDFRCHFSVMIYVSQKKILH